VVCEGAAQNEPGKTRTDDDNQHERHRQRSSQVDCAVCDPVDGAGAFQRSHSGDHARDQQDRRPADAVDGLAEILSIEHREHGTRGEGAEHERRRERGALTPGDRDRLRCDRDGGTAAGRLRTLGGLRVEPCRRG
jgi:hypothetical protein